MITGFHKIAAMVVILKKIDFHILLPNFQLYNAGILLVASRYYRGSKM